MGCLVSNTRGGGEPVPLKKCKKKSSFDVDANISYNGVRIKIHSEESEQDEDNPHFLIGE